MSDFCVSTLCELRIRDVDMDHEAIDNSLKLFTISSSSDLQLSLAGGA